jgi:TRAP-type uncharacterized transport system fused permease subunit
LAAHLFVFYFGMASMITPPVAPAAIVGAGIAGASMWKTGYTAMRLGILILIIPFMFAYNPVLLLDGPLPAVIQATITSLIGVICLGAALQGYLLHRANVIQRIMLASAALGLIDPGLLTDIIGIGLLAGVVMWQWYGKKWMNAGAVKGVASQQKVLAE